MCTFEQVTNLIATKTNNFTSTIKELVNKFETLNNGQLEVQESNLQDLISKVNELEKKLDHSNKQNLMLKNLLND